MNNKKISLLILILTLTQSSYGSLRDESTKKDGDNLNSSTKLSLDKYLPFLPTEIQSIITGYNSKWELKKTLFGEYSLDGISYSPDGRYLATYGYNEIRIFDAINYNFLHSLKVSYNTKYFNYSPCNKYLTVIFEERKAEKGYIQTNINIYDAIDNYKLLNTLTISKDTNTRLILHSSNNRYLACPENNKVKVFDINNKYKHFFPIDESKSGKINCIAYSPVSAKADFILSDVEVSGTPDNKYLATAGSIIKIWDTSIDNIEQVSEKQETSSSKVLSAVKIFFGNAIRTLLNKVNYKLIAELKGNDNEIISIQYSPNNKYIASMEKFSIKIWDASSYNLLHNIEPIKLPHSSFLIANFTVRNKLNSMAYSKSGKYLAAGSENGNIYIWDAYDYKLLTTIINEYPVTHILFSPNNWCLSAIINDKTATKAEDIDYISSTLEGSTEEKYHRLRDYNTIKIWQYEGID